jgi:hypothetical protein
MYPAAVLMASDVATLRSGFGSQMSSEFVEELFLAAPAKNSERSAENF